MTVALVLTVMVVLTCMVTGANETFVELVVFEDKVKFCAFSPVKSSNRTCKESCFANIANIAVLGPIGYGKRSEGSA